MAQFNKIVYIIKNALYIRILHFEHNMIYIILGNYSTIENILF